MDGLKKLLLAGVAAPLALTAFANAHATPLPAGATESGKVLLAQTILEEEEQEGEETDDSEDGSPEEEDGDAASGEDDTADDGEDGPEAAADDTSDDTGEPDRSGADAETDAEAEPEIGSDDDTRGENADTGPDGPAADGEARGEREGLRQRLRERGRQERPEQPAAAQEAPPDAEVESEFETDGQAETEQQDGIVPESADETAEQPQQESEGGIGERLRNLLSGEDEGQREEPAGQRAAPDSAAEPQAEEAEQADEGRSLRERLRQRRQQERQAGQGEDRAAPADEAAGQDDERDGERRRERAEEGDDRERRPQRAQDGDDRDGIDRVRERSAEEREERREEFRDRIRDRSERTERRRDDDPEEERDEFEEIEEVREELRDEVRELRRQREEQLEALREEIQRGGDRVIERTGDRLIIRNENNNFYIQHNDTSRFVRGAEDVEVRQLRGGFTETIVRRPGGVMIVTIRDRSGEIVTRTRVTSDGREIVLIDNRSHRDDRDRRGFRVDYYSRVLPPLRIDIPREQYIVETRRASPVQIRQALTAPPVVEVEQSYALGEVLHNERLRDMVPRVDLDTITFEFDSAEVPDAEIETLEEIGYALEEILAENPDEIYLVEGHTDAPGSNTYNLALSDRRAENVAVILSEFFEIPPENLVTQGYGEEYLKIPTQSRERENRRVTIRRITPLLAQSQ